MGYDKAGRLGFCLLQQIENGQLIGHYSSLLKLSAMTSCETQSSFWILGSDFKVLLGYKAGYDKAEVCFVAPDRK